MTVPPVGARNSCASYHVWVPANFTSTSPAATAPVGVSTGAIPARAFLATASAHTKPITERTKRTTSSYQASAVPAMRVNDFSVLRLVTRAFAVELPYTPFSRSCLFHYLH